MPRPSKEVKELREQNALLAHDLRVRDEQNSQLANTNGELNKRSIALCSRLAMANMKLDLTLQKYTRLAELFSEMAVSLDDEAIDAENEQFEQLEEQAVNGHPRGRLDGLQQLAKRLIGAS